nr:IclR family transcriptional regulator [uncultured bacterium]
MKSMASLGYLEYDEQNRSYLPAVRLVHLGSWISFNSYEQEVVLEQMWRLRDVAQESVVLATVNDIYIEYIETLHGWESMRIKRGTRRLLAQNGIGWQFLAQMDREEARAIYAQTIKSGELMREEFSEAEFFEKVDAHRGKDVSFVYAKELLRPTAHWGAAMMARLIPSPPGHRKLAIGAHGLSERLEAKSEVIANELERIAGALGERIARGL